VNNTLLSAHFLFADNPGAIYSVLGFLSGEAGSRLLRHCKRTVQLYVAYPRTSWPEPPAISVARASAENR
jgi:hypothetical protein